MAAPAPQHWSRHNCSVLKETVSRDLVKLVPIVEQLNKKDDLVVVE